MLQILVVNNMQIWQDHMHETKEEKLAESECVLKGKLVSSYTKKNLLDNVLIHTIKHMVIKKATGDDDLSNENLLQV